MKQKQKELFEKIDSEIVFLRNFSYPDYFFHYFSQLPLNHFENSFLLLKKKSKPILIVSPLDYGNVKKLKDFSIKSFSTQKDFLNFLKKEFNSKKVGFNAEIYPQKNLSMLKKKTKPKKFEDVSSQLKELRWTKTKKEIKLISKSAKIADKTLLNVKQVFSKNMTEKELAVEIEFMARGFGADSLSFASIVAFGKNSSTPHHVSGNTKISKGILLFDFGVRYKNYCSDLTRMYSVGTPSKKESLLYDWLYSIQRKTISLLKPGVKSEAVHLFVEKKLKEKKFSLNHSIGHGLGLEVHDFPNGFSRKTNWLVEEKNVFAIEPAFYSKQFGMRIEDNVLVTKRKPKLLSSAPEHLLKL